MGGMGTNFAAYAHQGGVDLEAELYGTCDRDVIETLLSWSEWDALVAAVEENRPVPYAVEN